MGLEGAFAIQAALAAFPPPKAAPQASRLRLVRCSTTNPLPARFKGLSFKPRDANLALSW